MEKFLFVIFIFIFPAIRAQVDLTETILDFGTLRKADQVYREVGINNATNESVVIFRIEVPDYVDVAFSAKTIAPGGTEYIRLVYNPQAAGPFREEYRIYASSWKEPKRITVKGESTYASDQFIPCPDFDDDPAQSMRKFTVSVRNRQNEPIDGATVHVFKEGNAIGGFPSDEAGEVVLELPLGKYFFSVSVLDTSVFVNATNDHLLAIVDEVGVNSIEQREPFPSTYDDEASEALVSENAESGALPLSRFKPNNLVFLVDVSTSMKHNGKLDLLKVAMVNLVDVLREVDRFTLISYSDEAGILVKTEGNLDKEACKQAIAALSAGGKTEGAKALDRAGKAAVDFYIASGNNQILLATDGAFNEGAEKASRLSAKYRRKGVITSVLGIKCGKFATREMTELAERGGGAFVAVDDLSDAGKRLLEEVKLRSAK